MEKVASTAGDERGSGVVVETPETNLSRGMKDLDGDFAQEINRRRGRVGHLFQGRFKGILVQRETHLLELLRYVVLNPVRAGMVARPGDWPWSSVRWTAGLETGPEWIEVNWTRAQFHATDLARACRWYREFVAAGIGAVRSPWEDVRAGLYLGTEEFGERLQQLVGPRIDDDGLTKQQRHPWRPSIGTIQGAVLDEFGLQCEDLRSRHEGEARAAFAWPARERGGARLREIGAVLGLSEARVSRLAREAASVRRESWGGSRIQRIERRLEEQARGRIGAVSAVPGKAKRKS